MHPLPRSRRRTLRLIPFPPPRMPISGSPIFPRGKAWEGGATTEEACVEKDGPAPLAAYVGQHEAD
jgi:hypothetical protein